MSHAEAEPEPYVTASRGSFDSTGALLAAIVESSDDAIVSKDLSGKVTSWNDAACRIFGYTAKEMIGQSILRILPPGLEAEEAAILERIRAGVRIEPYETRRIRKDGCMVEVWVTISPVKDAAGRIIGAAKIARDLSDRKRMEQRLIQSERLAVQGQMAANVTHQINSPLETITNLVYLARLSSPAGERAYAYLLSAEGELDRVAQLIRRTLGHYHQTADQPRIYLHDLVDEFLAVYRPKLHACGIAVDCRYEDRRPVLVNGTEIAGFFSTVLSAVAKVMPRGGNLGFEVRERAGATQDGVEITIRLRAKGPGEELPQRAFRTQLWGESAAGDGEFAAAREFFRQYGPEIADKTSEERDTAISFFVPFT
jgi:PAS domain S-box-containing protein